MRRVLVTGADGFIGSHLAELLVLNGYNVRALCQYNSTGSWGWLDRSPLAREMEIVLGDVRDPHQVMDLVSGVDIVFHLAALIAIPYSYTAPRSYAETNVIGTLNILEAVKKHHAKLVHTSTSEVYGTARYVPINESHPIQAQSPYSATKVAADALVTSYKNSFAVDALIARPFNTYGPRQSARAVIPTVITQVLSGERTIKLGALHPTRDFNYVADTCRGFLALAECEKEIMSPINIGSGKEISIGALVGLVAELMDVELHVENDSIRNRPDSSEVDRLLCDRGALEGLTGFKPEHTLRQGLEKTIAWLKDSSNLSLYKADKYNV